MSESSQEDYTTFRDWTIIRRVIQISLTGVLMIGGVALGIRLFVIGVSRVDGPSMEPLFTDGQWVVFEKASYAFRNPERFDVVEVIDQQHEKFLIKRIIGLPHESVIMRNGKVYIVSSSTPERELIEPYIEQGGYTAGQNNLLEEEIVRAGADEYIILGDNRLHSSNDSRRFGAIHRSHIVGRVIGIPRVSSDY